MSDRSWGAAMRAERASLREVWDVEMPPIAPVLVIQFRSPRCGCLVEAREGSPVVLHVGRQCKKGPRCRI